MNLSYVLQVFLKWRGPDSNWGYHDFQLGNEDVGECRYCSENRIFLQHSPLYGKRQGRRISERVGLVVVKTVVTLLSVGEVGRC